MGEEEEEDEEQHHLPTGRTTRRREEEERERKAEFGSGGELAVRLIDGGITSKGGGLFRGRP